MRTRRFTMMSRRGTSLLIVVCTCFCWLLLFRASHDNGLHQHQLSNDPFPGTGKINRLEPTVQTQCQLWFSNESRAVVSRVLEYKDKDKFDKATNNLRVIYNKPAEGEPKKKFAVCVKGLDFPEDDLSIRLTEWLEVLGSLGADKIFLYNLEVHPNITKVSLHNHLSTLKAECTWKHESVVFIRFSSADKIPGFIFPSRRAKKIIWTLPNAYIQYLVGGFSSGTLHFLQSVLCLAPSTEHIL